MRSVKDLHVHMKHGGKWSHEKGNFKNGSVECEEMKAADWEVSEWLQLVAVSQVISCWQAERTDYRVLVR
jgi:hypothetical protein